MHRRRQLKNVTRSTYCYTRVSSAQQRDEGISIEAQEAKTSAYCAAMGWKVTEAITDAGFSAKSLRRPGMTTLLAQVRAGAVERIVVTKLDRLTRSMKDLATLLELFDKYEVSLISLGETIDTGSAMGRMMINLIGVLSQWQREQISENTAEALGHMRSQRQAYGKTPFGFRRVGDSLVEEPAEQAALLEARRMDGSGSTLREIGSYLASLGLRSASWGPSSVRAMLNSRMTLEAA